MCCPYTHEYETIHWSAPKGNWLLFPKKPSSVSSSFAVRAVSPYPLRAGVSTGLILDRQLQLL